MEEQGEPKEIFPQGKVQKQQNKVDGTEKTLQTDELVRPGRFGVTSRQLIPVIKQLVAEDSIETLKSLRSTYLYSFENSMKYLKKSERRYIETRVK